MTATISTPVEAAQAVEQLGRVYASLAALRREVEPSNPRNFAILAQGHVEEIRSLVRQLDEYAGIAHVRQQVDRRQRGGQEASV